MTWLPTAHDRIQVRPARGVVPICGPQESIIGWRVRVWRISNIDVDWRCPVCRNRVRGWRADGAPMAHKCTMLAPWTSSPAGEGWREPHMHPREGHPRPMLFSTRQSAYATGLGMLDLDQPVNWMPTNPESSICAIGC